MCIDYYLLILALQSSNRLISASMDRTVRLWQMDLDESIHSFQRIIKSYSLRIFMTRLDTDIVTSVVFHPTNENLFLSGSLDSKLMLWNIEQKAAIHVVDTHEFITTVAFSLDGKFAISGSHSGLCSVYSTEVRIREYFVLSSSLCRDSSWLERCTYTPQEGKIRKARRYPELNLILTVNMYEHSQYLVICAA